MRYEEPKMEIIKLIMKDVVTVSDGSDVGDEEKW